MQRLAGILFILSCLGAGAKQTFDIALCGSTWWDPWFPAIAQSVDMMRNLSKPIIPMPESEDFQINFILGNTDWADVKKAQELAYAWMENRPQPVHAVLGCIHSRTSDVMARGGAFKKVPQMSWKSAGNFFTENSHIYPYFMRTISPMNGEHITAVHVMEHYGWKSVTMFYLEDAYANLLDEDLFYEVRSLGAKKGVTVKGIGLTQQAIDGPSMLANGTCPSPWKIIPDGGDGCENLDLWKPAIQEARRVANTVYLVYSSRGEKTLYFLLMAMEHRMNKFTWVLLTGQNIFSGISHLTPADQSRFYDGYQGLLATGELQDIDNNVSRSYKAFWQQNFSKMTAEPFVQLGLRSGDAPGAANESFLADPFTKNHAYLVDGLETIFIAIANLLKQGGTSATIRSEVLLEEMLKVNFSGVSGHVAFTKNGDRTYVPAELTNLQGNKLVKVGTIEESGIKFIPSVPVIYPDGSSKAPDGAAPTCGVDLYFDGVKCVGCGVGLQYGGSAQTDEVCQKCPHGRAGTNRCLDCNAGNYADVEGLGQCKLCPQGRFSGSQETVGFAMRSGMSRGMVACEACPAGTCSQHEGSSNGASKCVKCPVNTWEFNNTCRTCPSTMATLTEGSISLEQCVCARGYFGSVGGSCYACVDSWHQLPMTSSIGSTRRSDCEITPEGYDEIAIMLGFSALLSLVAFILLTTLMRVVLIEDISAELGTTVITTRGNHGFTTGLPGCHRRKMKVLLNGTGRPDLDKEQTYFCARVKNAKQLELLDKDGLPLKCPVDASQGALRLKLSKRFVHTGWYVPTLVWIAGLLCVAVFLQLAFSKHGGAARTAVAASAGVLMAVLLSFFLIRRRSRRMTPMMEKLARYATELLAGRPHVVNCERGPLRGITAGRLSNFYGFFQAFIGSRSMYYVNANITIPLTAKDRCSLSEFVGHIQMQFFVSHWWGHQFQHTVEALKNHAKAKAGDAWQDVAYWICSFSNNQWKLLEEIGDYDWKESSFYKALRSGVCRGTCMILDGRIEPFKRSWCMFEVLQTLLLKQENLLGDFEGLLFCTNNGVLNYGAPAYEVAQAIAGSLSKLRVEDANASVQADKEMIDGLIQSHEGGFKKVNSFISSSVRSALHATADNFMADFKKLDSELNAQESSPADGKAADGKAADGKVARNSFVEV